MDDAALVGMLERHTNLTGKVNKLIKIAGGAFMQAGSLDEFHHNEGSVAHLACVVNRDDIGVIELGDGFGLLKEARSAFCFHLVAGDEFHRHLALERRVEGAMHGAHASLAELFLKAVSIDKQRLAHR
jgi:hypothetical protein